MQRRGRNMSGYGVELFRNLLSLDRHRLALLTHKGQLLDQRLEASFQPVHRLDGATHVSGDENHRDRDNEKRNRDHHHYPKGRVVRIQLECDCGHVGAGEKLCLLVIIRSRFDASGKLCLALLVLIRLLAGFNCCRDRADLTGGGFTSFLRCLRNAFRRC